jgi:peroxiredoxin
LADYASFYPAFVAAGAELVALSVDPPDRSAAVARQLSLPFPILSDTRREVISAWGVLNAKERGGIAVPSVFVIDRDLRLKMLAIEKTHQRVSPDDVLQFVRTMQSAAGANQPPLRPVRPGGMFVRALVNALRRGVRVPRE